MSRSRNRPYDETHAPRLDREIAVVCRKQHGLITHAQLAKLMSRTSIAYRVRSGRLYRVAPKVFAVGHDSLSKEGRWHAAVLARGPRAALAGMAAAALWNMWRRSTPVPPRVVSPSSSRSLSPSDVTIRRGIPVTTVARTLLDLGDECSPWTLANVIHEAQFRRVFRRRQVDDVIRRNRGRRAVTVLRRALEINDTGSAGAKSALEESYALALAGAGVPVNINQHIEVEDDQIQVDLHWPELRLVVEVDGGGHDRTRSRREDRARTIQIRAAGWDLLRYGPGEQARCVAEVRRRLSGT